MLGLDRAPEVKTVRRKMGLLAARGKAAELLSVQARRHAAEHQEAMSVLYGNRSRGACVLWILRVPW